MRSQLISIVVALAPLVLGASSSEKEPSYGNAPEELIPYRQFQTPYKYFFEEPQLFLGPGREKHPPPGLKTVKIGFLGPIEGSSDSVMGQNMLNGATLALEEANRKGGYKGIPYAFVIRNDTGLWGASSNEIVRLNEEKVWAVLGSIDGANTHIVLRVVLKMELPMINTGSSDPTLTETRIPWMIRCFADDRQNGYALAIYIFKEKGYTRVAVLRNNNRYGRTGIMEFKDSARRLGNPVLFELRYDTGDSTFAPQLERIRKSSAEAVVIWGNADEAGHIVKEMREMGMEQAVLGCDRLVSPEFLRIAGEGAEGVTATHPYNPKEKDPRHVSFVKRYKEMFGEEPESFAAHAYDGMNILIEAIQKAGLNRAKIRDALTEVKHFRGVTGEILLDASHNDIGPIWMAEVRQGEFHFFPSPLERIKNTDYLSGEKTKLTRETETWSNDE
jgi:ABC-type branched-subunit amino acid transport system substrate-binding protein